jgi:predicted nucleotidyltransferase
MPDFINLDRLHYPPRPANARAEVEKILTALVEDYGAEKIIAFGSTVRGGVTEHSDIDLCVIRQHPPGCTHPGLEARLAAGRYQPLISKDILVKDPAQYRLESAHPIGAMQEVVEHGLTVYER